MSAANRKLYDEIAHELIDHMKHIPDAEHIIRGYFQERLTREVRAEQVEFDREFQKAWKSHSDFFERYATNGDFGKADNTSYQQFHGGGRAYGKSQKAKAGPSPFEKLFNQAYQAAHPEAEKMKTKNPERRRIEIEDELDIIRGVKPTPKGYKVNPAKVKALMNELRELDA